MLPNAINTASPLSSKVGITTEAKATWAVSAAIADTRSNTGFDNLGLLGTQISNNSPICYYNIA